MKHKTEVHVSTHYKSDMYQSCSNSPILAACSHHQLLGTQIFQSKDSNLLPDSGGDKVLSRSEGEMYTLHYIRYSNRHLLRCGVVTEH